MLISLQNVVTSTISQKKVGAFDQVDTRTLSKETVDAIRKTLASPEAVSDEIIHTLFTVARDSLSERTTQALQHVSTLSDQMSNTLADRAKLSNDMLGATKNVQDAPVAQEVRNVADQMMGKLKEVNKETLTADLKRAVLGTVKELSDVESSLLEYLKKYLRFKSTWAALVLLGGTIAVYVVWYHEGEPGVLADMVKAFEDGGAQGWDTYDDTAATIERPILINDLQSLLRPPSVEGYVVIVGEESTGKSTAVRMAIRSLSDNNEKGVKSKGVVYVLVEDHRQFSRELAAVLRYRRPFHLMDTLRLIINPRETHEETHPLADEPYATWAEMMPLVKKAARMFKDKHGCPPTITIDAADRLAKHDQAFFLTVNEAAKDGIDNSNLIIVKVLTKGIGLDLLTGPGRKSAWARSLPVYEINEVTDKEATEFLVKRGVEQERAENCVTLFHGGRLRPLLKLALSDDTMEATQLQCNDQIVHTLKQLELKKTHPLFVMLQRQGAVLAGKAADLVGEDRLSRMLEGDLLSFHGNSTYTLNRRYHKRFFNGQGWRMCVLISAPTCPLF
jgi:hypothetical protein